MATDYDNLWWKLHESVGHLVTGSGTLKARLKNVLYSQLTHLTLSDPPSDAERLIADAIALATSRKDETGVLRHRHVTLSKTHWKKDKEVAQKIFQAYEIASREYYRTRSV